MLLFGACTLCASSRIASSGSNTAGSGSYSTLILSSASSAICSVTAATAATPSPAWNTRSSASTGWSFSDGPNELTGISRPVSTAITPGMASASRVSMRLDARRGDTCALDFRVQHSRKGEVVDVAGLAESVQAAVGPRGALADRRRLLANLWHQGFERIGHGRRYRRQAQGRVDAVQRPLRNALFLSRLGFFRHG